MVFHSFSSRSLLSSALWPQKECVASPPHTGARVCTSADAAGQSGFTFSLFPVPHPPETPPYSPPLCAFPPSCGTPLLRLVCTSHYALQCERQRKTRRRGGVKRSAALRLTPFLPPWHPSTVVCVPRASPTAFPSLCPAIARCPLRHAPSPHRYHRQWCPHVLRRSKCMRVTPTINFLLSFFLSPRLLHAQLTHAHR